MSTSQMPLAQQQEQATLREVVEALRLPLPPEKVRWRPAGKDKNGRQLPPVPYISWFDAASILDERLGGLWKSETVSIHMADVADAVAASAVTVRLTIALPDGRAISRDATAWHQSSHHAAPSVEVAERRALVRAAALFGLAVPRDAKPPAESRNRGNDGNPGKQRQS